MLNLWMHGSMIVAVSTTFIILGFLGYASWPYWHQYGISAMFSTEWYPYEQAFGLLPALLGTFWSVGIALLIAIPTGLAAATISAELLSGFAQAMVRFVMELLAGIPSVVYGLLGLWVLLPFLQTHLHLLTGHNLLAAGLLLSIMILPTMMVMALDALREVDMEQQNAASHLGMDWGMRLRHILLPQAWPGIRAGILLGLGRAMGETMAVMLVVGSMDRVPEPWYNLLTPAQTVTSRIGREIGEAVLGSMHFSALMACGLLLALATVIISLLTVPSHKKETICVSTH